jgi:hypothetical protein
MILAFLFVLAGPLVGDGSQVAPRVSGGFDPQLAQRAGSGVLTGPFKIAQLELARSPLLNKVQLFKLLKPGLSAKATGADVGQLQNKRTGVTCTLRIIHVEPPVDSGVLMNGANGRPDPIVRDDLSPCVE